MWMQIISALILVMMIVFLWPRARAMMKESPDAQPGDWQAVALPLLAVVGFVVLLMYLI